MEIHTLTRAPCPMQMARELGGPDFAGLDRSDNTILFPASRYDCIRAVTLPRPTRQPLFSRAKSMAL